MTNKVALVIGSVRKDSLNRKLARAMVGLAPAGMAIEELPIAHLPLYNPDQDEAPPQAWTELRAKVRATDGILFVTPEHNRSVPAALKNAIDIASRPYGQNAWDGKPAAVVTGSPGAIGGFGSNHHLRQSLVFLNMPALPQPEAYIGHLDKLFDAKGDLANEGTAKFLAGLLGAFDRFITRNKQS